MRGRGDGEAGVAGSARGDGGGVAVVAAEETCGDAVEGAFEGEEEFGLGWEEPLAEEVGVAGGGVEGEPFLEIA